MADKRLICPNCNQDDQVFKVRQLYVESIAKVKPGNESETPELDRLLQANGYAELPKAKINQIVNSMIKSFAPPSGKPELLRTISPDMVVVVFALVSVFFLYQIYMTQQQVFWITLAIFALFVFSYIVLRKSILARFQHQKDIDTSSKEVIERAIGKWMKMSYCARDNIVFGVKKGETVKLEEMNNYLLQNSLQTKES